MMMKKISDEDKKAIKQGLESGYTFDEIMETLEASEKMKITLRFRTIQRQTRWKFMGKL
jgi:hypothetical protein